MGDGEAYLPKLLILSIYIDPVLRKCQNTAWMPQFQVTDGIHECKRVAGSLAGQELPD